MEVENIQSTVSKKWSIKNRHLGSKTSSENLTRVRSSNTQSKVGFNKDSIKPPKPPRKKRVSGPSYWSRDAALQANIDAPPNSLGSSASSFVVSEDPKGNPFGDPDANEDSPTGEGNSFGNPFHDSFGNPFDDPDANEDAPTGEGNPFDDSSAGKKVHTYEQWKILDDSSAGKKVHTYEQWKLLDPDTDPELAPPVPPRPIPPVPPRTYLKRASHLSRDTQ
ncbi:hypothetical protein [Bathymodiolus platifrons methanotrophic gill symbiont]|uniref:hypothetical protein n=1 Tax=Bathymodiolus platifrons methanotrophic gill symbiont TaxID=113268 RepID=UPI001124F097|nr:hypothetical protein [Bathymodiolus platifrons methanotrophic gill symbiont]